MSSNSHCFCFVFLKDCGSAGVSIRSGSVVISRTKIQGCGGPAIRAFCNSSAAASGPLPDAVIHADTSIPLNPIDAARDDMLGTDGAKASSTLLHTAAASLPLLAQLPASVYCSHSDLRGNAGGSWDIPTSMWQDFSAFSYVNQLDTIPSLNVSAKAAIISSPVENGISLNAKTGAIIGSAPFTLPIASETTAPPIEPLDNNSVRVDVVEAPRNSTATTTGLSVPESGANFSSNELGSPKSPLPGLVESASTAARRITRYTVDAPCSIQIPPSAAKNSDGAENSDSECATSSVGKRKRECVSGVVVVIDDRCEIETHQVEDLDDKKDGYTDWNSVSSASRLAPSSLRAGREVDHSAHDRENASLPAPNRRRLFVHATPRGDAAVYLVTSARRRQMLSTLHGAHFDPLTSLLQPISSLAMATIADDVPSSSFRVAGVESVLSDSSEVFNLTGQVMSLLGSSASAHPFVIVHVDAALGGLASAMAHTHEPDSNVEATLAHHRTLAVARVVRGNSQPQISPDASTAFAAAQAQERALARLANRSLMDSSGNGSPGQLPVSGTGQQRDPYAKVYISAHGQRADYHAITAAAPVAFDTTSAVPSVKPRKKKKVQQVPVVSSAVPVPVQPQQPQIPLPQGITPQYAGYSALLLQQQQLYLQQHLQLQASMHALGLPRGIQLPGAPRFPRGMTAGITPPGLITPVIAGAGFARGPAALNNGAQILPPRPQVGVLNVRAPRMGGLPQIAYTGAISSSTSAAGTLTPEMLTSLQYQQSWMQQNLLQQHQQQQQLMLLRAQIQLSKSQKGVASTSHIPRAPAYYNPNGPLPGTSTVFQTGHTGPAGAGPGSIGRPLLAGFHSQAAPGAHAAARPALSSGIATPVVASVGALAAAPPLAVGGLLRPALQLARPVMSQPRAPWGPSPGFLPRSGAPRGPRPTMTVPLRPGTTPAPVPPRPLVQGQSDITLITAGVLPRPLLGVGNDVAVISVGVPASAVPESLLLPSASTVDILKPGQVVMDLPTAKQAPASVAVEVGDTALPVAKSSAGSAVPLTDVNHGIAPVVSLRSSTRAKKK